MTLLDPSEFDSSKYLFVQSVDFPQVLALPDRRYLPEGDLLTFYFPNGYGASVTRNYGQPLSSAFEFCVLDCTYPDCTPTYQTPVAPHLMISLSYEQVAELLPQAENLPLHPKLEEANEILEYEKF